MNAKIKELNKKGIGTDLAELSTRVQGIVYESLGCTTKSGTRAVIAKRGISQVMKLRGMGARAIHEVLEWCEWDGDFPEVRKPDTGIAEIKKVPWDKRWWIVYKDGRINKVDWNEALMEAAKL